VTKGHAYRTYDWASASGLVDQMLGSYSLRDELAALPRAA
jgi:4-hydroxyphenylacetate 3-monooxygenase